MQASELAGMFVELLDVQDSLAQDLVLTTVQEQLGGAINTGIPTEELVDTLLCHRTGECNCFHKMVNNIIEALTDDEEDEGGEEAALDPKFAAMMAKVATGRMQ